MLSFLYARFCHLCQHLGGCSCVDLYLDLVFHLSICLFVCQHHPGFDIEALRYDLKLGMVTPLKVFFLFRFVLTTQGCLCFHIHFDIAFLHVLRNNDGILIGLA